MSTLLDVAPRPYDVETLTPSLCHACLSIRRAMAATGLELKPEPVCEPCPFAEQYQAITPRAWTVELNP